MRRPALLLFSPMLAAVVLIAIAGAVHVPVLLVPAGAILFIVGARIAYNHRGAGDVYSLALRKNVPRWFPRLAPATERTLDGSIIGALGVVLSGFGLLSL
jgi:hypothetical protein